MEQNKRSVKQKIVLVIVSIFAVVVANIAFCVLMRLFGYLAYGMILVAAFVVLYQKHNSRIIYICAVISFIGTILQFNEDGKLVAVFIFDWMSNVLALKIARDICK